MGAGWAALYSCNSRTAALIAPHTITVCALGLRWLLRRADYISASLKWEQGAKWDQARVRTGRGWCGCSDQNNRGAVYWSCSDNAFNPKTRNKKNSVWVAISRARAGYTEHVLPVFAQHNSQRVLAVINCRTSSTTTAICAVAHSSIDDTRHSSKVVLIIYDGRTCRTSCTDVYRVHTAARNCQ